METDKEYKDIDDIKNELKSILIKFDKIDQRMIAISLDYNQYFKRNISREIYDLRDTIIYRLNATKLHIQILVNLIDNLDSELTSLYGQENGGRNVHLYFAHRKSDISALLDSIIFHIISAFDYVSVLVSYICFQKDKRLKWTNLAKSARDQKNPFSKTTFSNIIDDLDRTFVGRLYDHRSYLIHESRESRSSSFSIDLLNGKVKTKINSSNQFNKNFSKLRKQENDFSLAYILFWLIEESTNSILNIQYGLKEFMEENKKFDQPVFYSKNINGEKVTITKDIWDSKD